MNRRVLRFHRRLRRRSNRIARRQWFLRVAAVMRVSLLERVFHDALFPQMLYRDGSPLGNLP